LQAGKTVILPPNGLSETLAQAAHHADEQVLPDTAVPHSEDDDPLFDSLQLKAVDMSLPFSARIVFFTSGSSGQPKLVEKALWQLHTEIQVIQQTFAGLSAQKSMVVAATVPHQHIYGLLFRILWPFSQGWTLLHQTVHFAEQWLALNTQQHPVVLISSPAHLTRYDDVSKVKQWPAKFVAVFSSGGPLAMSDAVRFYQQSGLAITQIYGSTETGGIGYKQQLLAEHEAVWRSFAGMQIAQDEHGCLLLRSPYLAEPEWYVTTDLVTLHDAEQFSLGGRVDRIVKLAEKRLSLFEVENLCNSLSFVRQAVALIVPANTGATRAHLALVIELTETGQHMLVSLGKHAVNQQIKQALAARFETVLLPRRFRYVDQLPFNAQGKLPLQQLELLFL
jgi:acyl-coenzyme A synthetase/AMP-(fatty) acid ligase